MTDRRPENRNPGENAEGGNPAAFPATEEGPSPIPTSGR